MSPFYSHLYKALNMKIPALVILLWCGSLAALAQPTGPETLPQEQQPPHSAPPVPDSFILFGERVPLDIWDVRERLDREILINTYLQGTSLYILKLATRWMPMIEQRLKANAVPDDFKYLCVAESALQNQVSKAGATGFWQFMRSSAPVYGLEINNEVDERYHVEKSTEAACRYLNEAYRKFGSWTAAAASYNCGIGGYANAVSAQGTSDYYRLLLPEETMRYLFRIMALKHILEDPARSGFILSPAEQYSPLSLRQVEVSHAIPSLVQFAADQGTDYKTIRLLNPWLRSNRLTNKYKKRYTLLLPARP
ncbi:MAG: lytic transglycosylase domain-containing protein [Chitinophagaceae bacterium]